MNSTLYLTQTDTTVGFVSEDPLKIAQAKNRHPNQPLLRCVETFAKQKELTRTPKMFKKMVRRAKKTTFIYPNQHAIRVVFEKRHKNFLKPFPFLYSSSANPHKAPFSLPYATQKADVIVYTKEGFLEKNASKLLRLGKRKVKRLR